MFSFHKPKTYRSGSGCCICRAKSSSSRFTDSKRYEEDFSDCFKLSEKRTGEICNACVLLVKRWKKLPRGSERNWQHVVDARAGHGNKTVSRLKKPPIKREKLSNRVTNTEVIEEKKEFYIPKLIRTTREESPYEYGDNGQLECLSNESGSYDSSLAPSPVPSPVMDNPNGMDIDDTSSSPTKIPTPIKHCRKERKKKHPKKSLSTKCSFLDLDFWKREKTCCGIIFKGPCGEVLLDRRFLNPCYCRSSPSTSPQSEHPPSEGYFSEESSNNNNNNNLESPPSTIKIQSQLLPPSHPLLPVPLGVVSAESLVVIPS